MKTSLTLAFALLLICTGTALASTPDGTPPSGETVCDGEVGAAYGLCTAYCEAMDCESDDPHASETACNKVGTKFQNITGRDVPCEVPAATCPCNDVPGPFRDLIAGTLSVVGSDCDIRSGGAGITIWAPNFSINAGGLFSGQWLCGPTGDNQVYFFNLSPEVGQLCFDLAAQAAASQGLTCATPE